MQFAHLKEALRIFHRARHIARHGFHRYNGDSQVIARQIISDCYNGRYFQVSQGHFCQFYVRDFAFCVEALLGLGYQEEVEKTIGYALDIFKKHGRITTTITPDDKPIDVFHYSPDSLPLFLMSIRKANPMIADQYKGFIQHLLKDYQDRVVDKYGFVRNDRFSSMKDQARRACSCYDMCMAAMLGKELDALGFENPLRKDYAKLIKKMYWAGEYFLDDLSGKTYVAGDAQVFPFWCGIFDDKKMLAKVMQKMHEEELDVPFPLKYTAGKKIIDPYFPLNLVLGDYETNTIWMHLGLCFVDIVPDKEKYLRQYEDLLLKHRTFLELYEPDGSIYRKFHYAADEGMLWVSKWLYWKRLHESKGIKTSRFPTGL